MALIPTMGALHDGHLALVRHAQKYAARVIVSIFVNPTQFAPNEDFASYPRMIDADLCKLTAACVDLVWEPTVQVMYPTGHATRIITEGPALAGLEDRFRPHFFAGVATVVAKLFMQCQPDFAMFGEKDYQQLKVVTRMAKDLGFPLKVIGVPTKREKDGLAMSSRNAYLSGEQRQQAALLYRTLKDSADQIKSGKPIAKVMGTGVRTIEDGGFVVDYFEARHAENLSPVASLDDGPVRLLVAARLGRTRLIDNIKV